MATIDTNWSYNGLKVIRLENARLCLDILPDLGAKIYNLIHKPSGQNLLWHNPRVLPERAQYGSSFDNQWSGGWDEIFPNDLPGHSPEGELLPDHGETWSQEAEWRVLAAGGESCSARFTSFGRILPVHFEKTVELREGETQARIHYEYTNLGRERIPFLWNLHPALAISPGAKLCVPARRGISDPWSEAVFRAGTEYEWPFGRDRNGKTVDMREILPPESKVADLHYLVDVAEGWYAIPDLGRGVGFGLVFPREIFRHVWLFRPFGGWRGLYTVILEPGAGYPYSLDDAARQGTCAWLEPGGTVEADVLALALEGFSEVQHISQRGEVQGR